MTEPNRKRNGGLLLIVALDPDDERPLHRQVYDGVRAAILEGRLRPGTRLPATRVLSAELGVSRNTVATAFDQLRVEGYIAGRRGGGTRVRSTLPDALLSTARAAQERPPSRAMGPGAPRGLSGRGLAAAQVGRAFMREPESTSRAFRLGAPPVDAFPADLWAKLTAAQWRRGKVQLDDSGCTGHRGLREEIASYLNAARGARCSADQVLIVNGAQQALDLVMRVLLDAGEAAWLEDPGYLGARVAMQAAGVRIVPVAVDGEGLDVAAGEGSCAGARLAYVTPSHQFPLGSVMSASRRMQLLEWARRANAWVLEDDYDSEFRYEGRPLPCLQGLDDSTRVSTQSPCVLYVGTFTKTLALGMRIGYLVVPEFIADAFRAARAALDRHTTTLNQGVLADLFAGGHYTRHLRRVRALCAERQTVLIDAARADLGDLLHLSADPAGLHLVGWLPTGVSDVAAARAAAAQGVEASPLSRNRLTPDPAAPGALLLGYASCNEHEIRDGVRRLRKALLTL